MAVVGEPGNGLKLDGSVLSIRMAVVIESEDRYSSSNIAPPRIV